MKRLSGEAYCVAELGALETKSPVLCAGVAGGQAGPLKIKQKIPESTGHRGLLNNQTNYFTRSRYSPVRVSILMRSPMLMNSGIETLAPVSTVAGLSVLVAVSPFTPGSV